MPIEKSPQEDNYAYQAYIKDVFIELPNYKFNHRPLGEDDSNNKFNKEEDLFLGRKEISEKFLNILKNSGRNSSGSYLITGYRGMGKTSFVKKVIERHQRDSKEDLIEVEKIDISFAQSDLNEADILKQITNNLIQRAENNPFLKIGELFSLSSIFRFIGFALISWVLIYFFGYYVSKSYADLPKSAGYSDSVITAKKDSLSKLLVEIGKYSTNKRNVFKKTPSKQKKYYTETKKISEKLQSELKEDSIKKISIVNTSYTEKFLETQQNPFKEILDNKSENKLTILLAYLVLLALFGLTITYAITTFKNLVGFILKDKKIPFFGGVLIIMAISIAIFVIITFTPHYVFFIIGTVLIFTIILYGVFGIKKYRFDKFGSVYYFEKMIVEYGIYKKLKTLQERSNATISSEQGIQSLSEQLPLGFIQRKIKQYAIKNPKEIEYELIDILKEYSKLQKYRKRFIIVFDELDKVEPSLGKGFYHEDVESTEQTEFTKNKINEIRNRKNLIINILATLKYFITVADAKFVFIAGREMFDASLADIADRESFISSIFHQVIYVDSFMKDSDDDDLRTKGITGLVDSYLEKLLIPIDIRNELKNKERVSFLKNYYDYLESNKTVDLKKEEILKVIYLLQNFVIYLTYRSNGSPKKLSKLIEEHIRSGKEQWDSSEKKNELKLIVRTNIKESCKNRLFLYFPYKQQYRFGFITYLFRPFILAQSQVIKKFSDTILVSTPYLMDHIIKFHPFAFSIENLELIPEIIANNRNPMFRYFIEELIKYLRSSHIRETELGLFDYKFFSKTTNEITYISKVYEDELAAFNFSLDEMYNVKQYVQSKIKVIRSNYSQLNTGDNENGKSVIYSIAFLNNLLGDTQYFDQEYDNAIVAYLDGLQLLRGCEENTFERIILSIKLKLKLGLIYEKMKNNGMALSYFNDAVAEVRTYIYTEMKGTKNMGKNNFIQNSTKKMISYSEVLQVANLPYAASLYLQEKHNVEGVNIERLNNYSKDFEVIVSKIDEKDGKNKIVLADHFNDLGNLLYYKNFVYDSGKSNLNSPFLFLLKFNDISDIKNVKNEKIILKSNSDYNKDFRASFKSFLFYKNAIEVLINDNVHVAFHTLCEKGAKDIRYFDNKYSKTFLKTLAFSFSNAGNLLFSITNKNSENAYILNDYLELWRNREGIAIFFENESKKELQDLNMIKQAIKAKFSKNISAFFDTELEEDIEGKQYKLRQFEGFKRPMVFWDIITNHYFKNSNKSIDSVKQLEFVIFNYYLAGRFYSKIGKNVSFSFQLRKILQIVRNTVFDKDNNVTIDENKKIAKKQHVTEVIKLLEESLLPMILEATSWNSNATDRPQVYKYKYIEGINDIYHPLVYTKHNYSNISNNPETKEAIFFMADLKVRNLDLNDKKFEDCTTIHDFKKIIPEMHLVHPYNGISSQFSRLQEFDLQEKINQALLPKVFPSYKIWEDKLFKIHKRSSLFLKKENKSSKVPTNFLEVNSNLITKFLDTYLDLTELKRNYPQNPVHNLLIKIEKFIQFSVVKYRPNETNQKLKPKWLEEVLLYHHNLDFEDIKQIEIQNIIIETGNDENSVKNVLNIIQDFFLIRNISSTYYLIKSDNKLNIEDYKKLTANSIFSLIQVINIIKIYGVNQYLSYSYLAHFQRKLGIWLKHYELCELYDYFKNIDDRSTIKFYLENMIGSEAMVTLDTTSQFQIALQYYHKAKQMHSNGITYHQDMSNYIYLEGDFDDNLYHFGIALERQKINSHQIRDRIKELEKELETSPLYKYDNYANTNEFVNT